MSSYQTCAISRGPVTGKAFALPMAETPYKLEQTEHGPWWLFSLPFRVKDNGNDMTPPASPGDHEVNNTPEEVAEAVVAAVSLRHIQRWIDKTTPSPSTLQQITANNPFTTIRPFRFELTGDVRQDFDALADRHRSFHVFNEVARDEFSANVQNVATAIAQFNAPTEEALVAAIANNATQLPGVLEGIAELVPGAVAVKFSSLVPAGQKKKSTVAAIRADLQTKLTALIAATNTGWEVVLLPEEQDPSDDDDDDVSKFGTIWRTAFKVQLLAPLLGEIAAKIAAGNIEQLSRINPVFITEHRTHGSLRTNFVHTGFAYATEAAWKAVYNLPVPRECRDWDCFKISESDFVGAAEALSDLVAAGYANGVQKFRQSIPAFFKANDGLHHVERMLTNLEYLLNTKHYSQDSADPVQRLINSLEGDAKFVFGIDPAPPFYAGVLDILLRTIIDGEGFLGDIAAKSSLTVRECQRIIYQRVYETKCVFDRLDYLRIKPAPPVTEHLSSMCDTDYHAKALRAIATAIKADGASTTKRNYRR